MKTIHHYFKNGDQILSNKFATIKAAHLAIQRALVTGCWLALFTLTVMEFDGSGGDGGSGRPSSITDALLPRGTGALAGCWNYLTGSRCDSETFWEKFGYKSCDHNCKSKKYEYGNCGKKQEHCGFFKRTVNVCQCHQKNSNTEPMAPVSGVDNSTDSDDGNVASADIDGSEDKNGDFVPPIKPVDGKAIDLDGIPEDKDNNNSDSDAISGDGNGNLENNAEKDNDNGDSDNNKNSDI